MERYRPLQEAAIAPQQQPEIVLGPSDEKLSAAMQVLEAGIDRVMTSDGFRDYLEAQSRFHQYSMNNTLMIMSQRPDASQVAGFQTWRKMGRHVMAGEKAMKIFVPHLGVEKDPVTGQKTEVLRGFGLGNVFDYKQTDGDPLPQPPRAEELRTSTEQGRELYDATSGYLASRGVPVFRRSSDPRGTVKGEYHPGPPPKIHVAPLLSDDMSAKTLIHEAAHYTADHKLGQERAEVESVAEGAAFVVMHRYGIDTSDYSFSYITRWSQNREGFKRNLNAIQSVSSTIIKGIEGRPSVNGV